MKATVLLSWFAFTALSLNVTADMAVENETYLLRRCIPILQEASQQVERHQQLMQDVLCNAQLVSLQREGGATMARLRKEAARLSFSPDVR